MTLTNSVLPPDPTNPSHSISLINFSYDPSEHQFFIETSAWVILIATLIALAFVYMKSNSWRSSKSLEINEAEIGIGSGKVKLRPNYTDRQVAYQIWVELSTRKIGLSIDLDHDVVVEVYDSWYAFFGVTRELIKSIPVSQLNRPSTKKIVDISIEVLNEGLRPHLTQWQARFRRWYDQQQPQVGILSDDPQNIQKQFPEYTALSEDILKVNRRLTAYRAAMHALVFRES